VREDFEKGVREEGGRGREMERERLRIIKYQQHVQLQYYNK